MIIRVVLACEPISIPLPYCRTELCNCNSAHTALISPLTDPISIKAGVSLALRQPADEHAGQISPRAGLWKATT